jgi:hypothetical protein
MAQAAGAPSEAAAAPTPTESWPPNWVNAGSYSSQLPSGRLRQVLVRGLPCAPPEAAPTATASAPRQATVKIVLCLP